MELVVVLYQRCKISENVVSHQFILSFFAVIYKQSRARQANFSPTCNGVSRASIRKRNDIFFLHVAP